MKKTKLVWFIKSSIALDFKFLSVSDWSWSKKSEFIFKKYQEIFLLNSGLKKFKLGENFLLLFGKKIYYDSLYGLAGYQSMLARPQKMIKDAQIPRVKTIIDVGANVGFFSLMARGNFPRAKIYALEPIPQTFTCLGKNFNGPRDKIFNLALGKRSGSEKMVFDRLNSATSHFLEKEGRIKEKTTEIINVKIQTLDKFCTENKINQIDILKIDTESFEADVLRGAQKSLERTRYLHLEISIEDNKNYTFSQINNLLYSTRFNFQLLSFRNYADKAEGPLPVGDFFYKNLSLER